MKLLRIAISAALLLLILQPLVAGNSTIATERFYAGNIAYAEQDYAAAEAAFRTALQSAESAALHHNLGNTLARMDRWAEAVVHYLKAHTLDPAMDSVHGNLMLAQSRLQLDSPFPLLPQPARALSANAWILAATTLFWLAILGIFQRIFLPVPVPFAKLFGALCCLLLGVALFAMQQHRSFANCGIVIADEVVLRVAPTAASPGLIRLEPGQFLHIYAVNNGFFHVRLADGSEGFLALSEISPINPSRYPDSSRISTNQPT